MLQHVLLKAFKNTFAALYNIQLNDR